MPMCFLAELDPEEKKNPNIVMDLKGLQILKTILQKKEKPKPEASHFLI